jgi:hypothetical protein
MADGSLNNFTDKAKKSGAFERMALERLLIQKNRGEFERNLYRRGTDDFTKKHYKYPLELGTDADDAHKFAMCIEIYDTNPELLKTKRQPFDVDLDAILGSEAAAMIKTAIANAKGKAFHQTHVKNEETGVFEKVKEVEVNVDLKKARVGNDMGGRADATLKTLATGLGTFFTTASELVAGGQVTPDMSGPINEKRNSFVEEATGVGGGTSLVEQRIYLYIPNNVEAGYGFEYETKNMAALDILKLGKALLEEGGEEAASSIGRKLAMTNMKVLDDLAASLPIGLEGGTIGKFLEATTRQIANPMQLHLFKEVKRRQFSFAYNFLPKSREELLNCYAIINTLKYYAHPATSGAGRFLDYPAEFNIKFLYGTEINKYMPFILKCALTNIKVKYGEDSVMSTFMPDAMGVAPTKIHLELTFDELEVLTRDRFDISSINTINP